MIGDSSSAMREPAHRTVDTNGIRMHIAEHGQDHPVLLCRGFPELWYSWVAPTRPTGGGTSADLATLSIPGPIRYEQEREMPL
jgi:hypothetical protein